MEAKINYAEKLEQILSGSYRSERSEADDSCLDEDDVFFGASNYYAEDKFTHLEKQHKGEQRPKKHLNDFSLNNKCSPCVWQTTGEGKPYYPAQLRQAPPNLVTLQYLSRTRDSGYEPSPTSANSFTFSSDEEDTSFFPEEKRGFTPPIDIPSRKVKAKRKTEASLNSPSEIYDADNEAPTSPEEPSSSPVTPKINSQLLAEMDTPKINLEPPVNKIPKFEKLVGSQLSIRDTIVVTPKEGELKRSRSVPDLACIPPLPRTPNIQMFPPKKLPAIPPSHGRNFSCPATTSDGRPLLTPPSPSTPASRASREGLIDLVDLEGTSGHKRRVLVLALPDLVRQASPVSGSTSTISEEDSSGIEEDSLGPMFKPPPTWRRPRAFSCDVTLEVEVGKDLRKIAEDFNQTGASAGLWTTFKNAILRRFRSLTGRRHSQTDD